MWKLYETFSMCHNTKQKAINPFVGLEKITSPLYDLAKYTCEQLWRVHLFPQRIQLSAFTNEIITALERQWQVELNELFRV